MGPSPSALSGLAHDILDEYEILTYLSKSEILSKVRPWIAKMRLTDLNRFCDNALKYLRWDVLKKSTGKTLIQPVLFFKAWRVFDYLHPRPVHRLYKTFTAIGADHNLNQSFSITQIEEAFPQLKCNPLKDRIYKVFSSQKNNTLSFEDILDLCSAMSEKCPDKVKAVWAFRIFDSIILFSRSLRSEVEHFDLRTYLETATDISTLNFEVQQNFDEDGAVGEQDLSTVIDRLTDAQNTNNALDVEEKKHIIRVLLHEIDLVDNGCIGELEFQQVVGKMPEFPHSFSFRI